MKNKLFYEVEFKTECYKIKLYFYDAMKETLTNVTPHVVQYVKALKDKHGLWTRGDYLYGGKYDQYFHSLERLFDGTIKETKNKSIFYKDLIGKISRSELVEIK